MKNNNSVIETNKTAEEQAKENADTMQSLVAARNKQRQEQELARQRDLAEEREKHREILGDDRMPSKLNTIADNRPRQDLGGGHIGMQRLKKILKKIT